MTKFEKKFEEVYAEFVDLIDELNAKIINEGATEMDILATQRATFVLNLAEMHLHDMISVETLSTGLRDNRQWYATVVPFLKRAKPEEFEKTATDLFPKFELIIDNLIDELDYEPDPFEELMRALGQ